MKPIDDTPKSDPAMNNAEGKREQWRRLVAFLETEYYAPDTEALRIVLAVYASHWFLKEKPIWLFLLGPSGTGKTQLVMNPLEWLPGVSPLSTIKPDSFLSGFNDMGILQTFTKESDGNGIITFPDFTTFLSEDFETQRKIVGILRQISEGTYEKLTGNKGNLEWRGKVTCIAACTNELERRWSSYHGLGERFLTLRWRYGSLDKYSDYADRHVNREQKLVGMFKGLVVPFVDKDTLRNCIRPEDRATQYAKCAVLKEYARFIGRMRVHVSREQYGPKRVITHISDEEAPGRPYKALLILTFVSACLFRRGEIEDEDINLARRLAIDSIPLARRRILSLVCRAKQSVAVEWIHEVLKGVPKISLKGQLEELVEIGALEKIDCGDEEHYQLSDIISPNIREALCTQPIRQLDTRPDLIISPFSH